MMIHKGGEALVLGSPLGIHLVAESFAPVVKRLIKWGGKRD